MDLLDKFFHTYHPRRGVVIHSRDVSMYYGNPLPEGRDVKSALAMGNMVASAKARYSDYGTREMVFSIADQPDSTVGLQRIKTLEKGGVIAVPTKPVEHPALSLIHICLRSARGFQVERRPPAGRGLLSKPAESQTAIPRRRKKPARCFRRCRKTGKQSVKQRQQ